MILSKGRADHGASLQVRSQNVYRCINFNIYVEYRKGGLDVKTKKIVVFLMFFIVFANFIAYSCESSRLHVGQVKAADLHICTKCVADTEYIEIVKMVTPRLQYLYFDGTEEIVYEIEKDVPENYFCVVIERKNWVQEARRNVDEHNTRTSVRKSC